MGRQPRICGAFDKQADARFEGGDIMRVCDRDGFRSLG